MRPPVLLVLNLGDFVCINTFSITNTKPELKHDASEKNHYTVCAVCACLALLIVAKNKGLWTPPLLRALLTLYLGLTYHKCWVPSGQCLRPREFTWFQPCWGLPISHRETVALVGPCAPHFTPSGYLRVIEHMCVFYVTSHDQARAGVREWKESGAAALAPRWELKGRVKSHCLLKVSCERTETLTFSRYCRKSCLSVALAVCPYVRSTHMFSMGSESNCYPFLMNFGCPLPAE